LIKRVDKFLAGLGDFQIPKFNFGISSKNCVQHFGIIRFKCLTPMIDGLSERLLCVGSVNHADNCREASKSGGAKRSRSDGHY